MTIVLLLEFRPLMYFAIRLAARKVSMSTTYSARDLLRQGIDNMIATNTSHFLLLQLDGSRDNGISSWFCIISTLPFHQIQMNKDIRKKKQLFSAPSTGSHRTIVNFFGQISTVSNANETTTTNKVIVFGRSVVRDRDLLNKWQNELYLIHAFRLRRWRWWCLLHVFFLYVDSVL